MVSVTASVTGMHELARGFVAMSVLVESPAWFSV